MKLAINYSPQAEMLVRKKSLELDLFKCPAASERVVLEYAPDLISRAETCRPIYVHFPLNAGDNSVVSTEWDEIEAAIDKSETRYVNLHLLARVKDYPHLRADTHDPADVEYLTDILIKDVALVAERFGPERVIVENVVYQGAEGKFLYPCIDPEVISRVVNETGCGFLLDTAHARLTCIALGREVKEYIAQLPVTRLKELHVTGAQSDGLRYRDSMAMGYEDWELIEWVIQQIAKGTWATPWALAFEYGGIGPGFEWRSDADVIAEQLPRLWKLAKTL